MVAGQVGLSGLPPPPKGEWGREVCSQPQVYACCVPPISLALPLGRFLH